MHALTRNVLVLTTAIALTACATDDPNRRAKTGAAVGAVAGAVLGHQVNSKSGRYVGAVAGAITGAAVGGYMDKQQQDFEQALEQEQEQHQLEIERVEDDLLKLSLSNEVSFDFNKSDLKPAFKPSLDKLASVLMKYDRTIVHVVGHTDSVGSEEYNMRLSEKRANSVKDYLVAQGVPSERTYAWGRGETQPRDTNDTEAGRQLNRRVEVFVKPIVEGKEQDAHIAP